MHDVYAGHKSINWLQFVTTQPSVVHPLFLRNKKVKKSSLSSLWKQEKILLVIL